MRGKLMGAGIYPHPPIILPEIGEGREKEAQLTVDGASELSRRIAQLKPQVVILISPHGPLFRDAVSIRGEEELQGDFGMFGHGELSLTFRNHLPFVDLLIGKSQKAGVDCVRVTEKLVTDFNLGPMVNGDLDHGALVPLAFLSKEWTDFQLVSITYGFLPTEKLESFGRCIVETLEEMGLHGVLIASGDLSHCLSEDGPYEYGAMGQVFDEKIVNLVKAADMQGILDFDYELSEDAQECGLRSFQVMAGALKYFDLDSEVFSYEGPFGVGYMTGFLENIGEKPEPKNLQLEDSYVKLARASLDYYLRTGQVMDTPSDLPEELIRQESACFVSIKKHGELRGCIGTIFPTRENMAREIIENAISAGAYDPRFPPVDMEEMPFLQFSVDILTKPVPALNFDELDPRKYGVIVTMGNRKGLLLPNLEGIDTVEEQLNIALRKGNISPEEPYSIEKFQVERHQ